MALITDTGWQSDYDEEADVLYASLGNPQRALSGEGDLDVLLRYVPPRPEVVEITIVCFRRHFSIPQGCRGPNMPRPSSSTYGGCTRKSRSKGAHGVVGVSVRVLQCRLCPSPGCAATGGGHDSRGVIPAKAGIQDFVHTYNFKPFYAKERLWRTLGGDVRARGELSSRRYA